VPPDNPDRKKGDHVNDAGRMWLITGVSSGFGRELASAVLRRGDTVIGTLRQAAQCAEFEALAPGRAHARLLDVTDAPAIPPFVADVLRDHGRVDVLVNNAGYGLFGAVEELNDDECRRVIETNFFGTLNLVKALLPHFRTRRQGHIVNLSSVAGFMGIAGVGIYCASKFAVTGLSESLAQELKPFGIKVTVVQPGGFRTNFAGGSLALASGLLKEYEGTPASYVRGMRDHYHGTQQGDPSKAADAIVAVVDSPDPPVHLLLGPDAVKMSRGKLAELTTETDAWESLSSGTDYELEKTA
jgi:NAD(P)-dependent dehydrogenase (short-subunit alcohol dehydrogenase family)